MQVRYLLPFASILLNNFLVFLIVYYTNDKKIKIDIKVLIAIFVCSFSGVLNNIYSISEIRLLGNYLIGIFMFLIIDRENLKANVFSFSAILIFGVLIELLVAIVLSLFFKNILEIKYLYQFIITILCYILWFGGWYVLMLNKHIKYLIEKVKTSFSSSINAEVLLMGVFIILDIILVKNYSNLKEHFLIFAAFMFLNILFILILIIVKNNFKAKSLEMSNNMLKQNIELYEKIVNDHNIMKHNLISDLIMIKSVSGNNAQKLINEKIVLYNKNYEWINDINKIPEGIRGLICLKIIEAKKQKVTIVSDCAPKTVKNITKHISSKAYLNLCEKLEVLMDNAVEAASECENKYVRIKITNIDPNKVLIEVLNPFKNEINTSKIGKIKYSTKHRDSGFGLYSFKGNKSDAIKVSFKVVDNIYIATINFLVNKKATKSS